MIFHKKKNAYAFNGMLYVLYLIESYITVEDTIVHLHKYTPECLLHP